VVINRPTAMLSMLSLIRLPNPTTLMKASREIYRRE
jgi:hypothetical protein